MNISFSYPISFCKKMKELKEKYGEELLELDGLGEQLDLYKYRKKFFKSNVTADVSVDPNSNVDDVSCIAYNVESQKPISRLNSYEVLWEELRNKYGEEEANKVLEMQVVGDIYIHDCHGIASTQPYCFNYATYDVLTKGLPMVQKIKSVEPKYLYSFKSQLEQFVVLASNSTLGATGLADMLVTMSYFVKNILETKSDAHFHFASEEDCWTYIKENLVSFIYTINQPSRAHQSPFTNVSIYDSYFLESVTSGILFPDGTNPDIEIVKKVQELFIDTMNEEMERTPVTYPVTTACFSVNDNNEIMDEEFAEMIAKKNLKFGFMNIYIGKTSTLSSCCRLRSDTSNEFFNSFGSGSSKIGSLGVCTINFPRLAIKLADITDREKRLEEFIKSLRSMVKITGEINNAKRSIVKEAIGFGHAPMYEYGFMELKKQYSTTGVNGFYESLLYLGYDIENTEGQKAALRIMKAVNEEIDIMQKEYNAPHNCEQIPGENTSIKLAKKDKYLGYQNEYDIYSNQFVPLIANVDMLKRIEIQGLLDSKFSGGSVLHLNVESQIEDYTQMVDLIKACAAHGCIYFAINYQINQCVDGHMSVGHTDTCGVCGKAVENKFTRVVGFLTAVKSWHKVRRVQDFPQRKFYKGIKINNEKDLFEVALEGTAMDKSKNEFGTKYAKDLLKTAVG